MSQVYNQLYLHTRKILILLKIFVILLFHVIKILQPCSVKIQETVNNKHAHDIFYYVPPCFFSLCFTFNSFLFFQLFSLNIEIDTDTYLTYKTA